MAETTTGRRYKRRPDAGRSRDRYTHPQSRTRHAARQDDIGAVKARIDCRALARALGLAVDARGVTRCFAAPGAHSNGDRTPSCSVRASGYRCFGCGARGDAIDLVRAVLGYEFGEALEWLRAYLGAPPASLPPAAPSPPRRPERRPPPLEELDRVWASALPVGDVPRVAAWLLEKRAIDPRAVEAFDLARALPGDASLPRWARIHGGPWTIRGYRLLVPCFDARGALVSLRARYTGTGEVDPKEAAPTGGAGGVMADPLGRLMLSGAPLGDGAPSAELVAEVGVVVAEGTPDFLSWATARSDAAEDAPAVVGLYPGAWCAEIAARIPDGARVTIATHDDPAGDRYAAEVVASLEKRARAGLLSLTRYRGPRHA